MSLHLRPGKPDDAEACGRICYDAFRAIANQHNFPPDFPSPDFARGLIASILPRKDVYSVVAEVEGEVVGSNFLWINNRVHGIGPITVDPNVQNGRVGRALMDDVMAYTERNGFGAVRLVQAAYHNRSLSLYAKLGFEIREPLATMQGPTIGEAVPGHDVRSAGEDDLDDCNALCHRIHGHDRGPELREAMVRGTASLVVHDGRITGYATQVGFSGHAVGESNRDLMALIAASSAFSGPGFLLPTRNGELFRWCLEKGLHVVQPMTLMSHGLYNEPAARFLPSILY